MNSLRKRTLYSEISDSVITVRNTTGEVKGGRETGGGDVAGVGDGGQPHRVHHRRERL